MSGRWLETDSYYSHGFLVPPVSVFLIWLNRSRLSKIPIKPDGWGWIFFICGISIHATSSLWQVFSTSAFSLILVIIGMVLLFLGREHLKLLVFPILFLLFMLPLPLVSIATISFKLKILIARISTLLINKLGIPAIREGSIIKTARSYLIVEDPCSGIKSLIAMIALGTLMAYFLSASRLKKGILVLSTIPISVGMNIIRITALLLVSDNYGARLGKRNSRCKNPRFSDKEIG